MPDNPIPRADQMTRPQHFSFVWLLAATALHLLLWSIVFAYLCFYVPRQKDLFADFGVSLSSAATLVIQLSDLATAYFPVLVPLAIILVAGVNALIVALVRSRAGRIASFAVLAACPIGWLISCHWVMAATIDRLMQALS